MSSSRQVSSPRTIGRRVFTMEDQQWFAQCSGDFNPVHLDPVVARRELPGAVVVHGVHLLLWSLEAYVAELRTGGALGLRVVRMKGEFRAPVYLDIPVEVSVAGEGKPDVKLMVVQDGQTTCKCSVTLESSGRGMGVRAAPPCRKPWTKRVVDVAFDDLPGKQGTTPVQIASDDVRSRFGGLADMLGTMWIAELMAITRVVGMESPGWHSMLAGMELVARPEVDSETCLRYTVEEADARMGLVTIRVEGAVSQGIVSAFYRPGVVPQMPYGAVKALVRPGEFDGQRALIIGGSRGIGEATAKLVAAGGGEVWLTYHIGEEDAQAVCRDVVAGGGRCRCSAYRAGEAESGLEVISRSGFRPTHLYYFATRRVTRARRPRLNESLLAEYVGLYVDGFADLHAGCLGRWRHPMVFFYPSSVTVQEATGDLVEYSRAKAAGEALCAELAARHPSHRVVAARLPVVATELSRGLLESASANAVEIMLPLLRDLQAGVSRQQECSP